MTTTYSGMNMQARQHRTKNSGRMFPTPMSEETRQRWEAADASVREPFKGITTDGTPISGLFKLAPTGVSTGPIINAAEALLKALDEKQRNAARFDLDSDQWRRWSNIHMFLMRHGAPLDEMSQEQRKLALSLLEANLSPQGFETARNVMRLNDVLRQITESDDEYGEWLYWFSVFGTPSSEQPWGWQVDGHHLNINTLLIGDQVVMTPMFMGSEPVVAPFGEHEGIRVFEREERNGLALMQSLTAEQRKKAVVSNEVAPEVFTLGFRDNFEMRYEGIRFDDLSSQEQSLLLEIVQTYVGRMPEGHAQAKMEEIKRHLRDTHFSWMGGVEDDSVFYYRVHSSVILIEFDHQRGVNLSNDEPSRNHIHTVVRTPNGNDYGKDLLRLHREQHAH